jgi:flagellar biosynthesis GTPase FlhF
MAYRFRKRKVAAFMATYSSDSESDLDSDFECGSRSKRKSLGGGLKLLNAEYQRDYRQQRKAKKSEEQLQRERELNKLRQRRYRKNRKVSIKRNTRNHTDVQRKKWRELKKKYLNNMPEEKKKKTSQELCKKKNWRRSYAKDSEYNWYTSCFT